ncbi:MAG: hypothetical protein WC805_00460 [Patescibacteria group bacterium]|jgi:hypothetical protein
MSDLPNKIVCTICSGHKSTLPGLIPAYLRYASSRIDLVHSISDQQKLPFFILSGKYGLINANQSIPYYDHLLLADEVEHLAEIVKVQLKGGNWKSIDFYVKTNDPAWKPYVEVITKAANDTGITLNKLEISSAIS